MKYCVIKDTCRTITQGEDVDFLKKEALKNMLNDEYFTLEDIEIVTEEEYLARVELEPKPITEPTTEELQMEYNIDLDYRISLIEMGGLI